MVELKPAQPEANRHPHAPSPTPLGFDGHAARREPGQVSAQARPSRSERAGTGELVGVLGRPVRCQQIPAEALRQKFLERGASASVAEAYFEMFKGFAREAYEPSERRTVETTTPTTLDSFLRSSFGNVS